MTDNLAGFRNSGVENTYEKLIKKVEEQRNENIREKMIRETQHISPTNKSMIEVHGAKKKQNRIIEAEEKISYNRRKCF